MEYKETQNSILFKNEYEEEFLKLTKEFGVDAVSKAYSNDEFSIYFFSCATTAKACLMSLLATATIANFPGFPFDRKRSKHALHSVLHRNDAIAPI